MFVSFIVFPVRLDTLEWESHYLIGFAWMPLVVCSLVLRTGILWEIHRMTPVISPIQSGSKQQLSNWNYIVTIQLCQIPKQSMQINRRLCRRRRRRNINKIWYRWQQCDKVKKFKISSLRNLGANSSLAPISLYCFGQVTTSGFLFICLFLPVKTEVLCRVIVWVRNNAYTVSDTLRCSINGSYSKMVSGRV